MMFFGVNYFLSYILFFFNFLKKFNQFMSFWLCWVFVALHAFSRCNEQLCVGFALQ